MNKDERAELKRLWEMNRKSVNSYRFAWWLIENKTLLVVDLLQDQIKAVNTDLDNQAPAQPAALIGLQAEPAEVQPAGKAGRRGKK